MGLDAWLSMGSIGAALRASALPRIAPGATSGAALAFLVTSGAPIEPQALTGRLLGYPARFLSASCLTSLAPLSWCFFSAVEKAKAGILMFFRKCLRQGITKVGKPRLALGSLIFRFFFVGRPHGRMYSIAGG